MIKAWYTKGLARVKVLKREPERRWEMERGSCTEKSPKPSGEGLRQGSQDLACGAVSSSVRVLQPATPSEEAETSMKRESGHPGARDLRQITRSPRRERGNKDPTELLSHLIPRGGLEPPRGGWEGGSLVTTHRSAPLLSRLPVAPSEPVPARASSESRKQRFPKRSRGGNVSLCPGRKWRNSSSSGPPDYECRSARRFLRRAVCCFSPSLLGSELFTG